MTDFVDIVGIRGIIEKSDEDADANFEVSYSRIHRAAKSTILQELDQVTRNYFSRLELPDYPTLYDYLVLSLRPKDLIITFNWDPLLVQAYKRWRNLGPVLPSVVFLHGNVDLGVNEADRVCAFLSDAHALGRHLKPTRLLYPVEQKDYNSDIFVADQWRMATDFLSEAYYVTVIGYSAPTTDVEARSLLLKAWRDNPTRELAEIDIIDIRDAAAVEASWTDFIVRSHGGAYANFSHSNLTRHPRRSCEAFAFATLQQSPWPEDQYPVARSLADLRAWIAPLLAEEASGKLLGKPHHLL